MTDDSEAGFDPSDPLVAVWAKQNETGAFPMLNMSPTMLADEMVNAHRKDQRQLMWLNMREVVPSVIVAGYFAFIASDSVRPMATLLSAAIVASVAIFLVVNSIRHHQADRCWGNSVRDQLARRHAQVDHRARLYRNTAWWYFLPFAVAIVLFRYGSGGAIGTFDYVFFGLMCVFLVAAYWVNRWIAHKKYEPEVERLTLLLAEFDRNLQ